MIPLFPPTPFRSDVESAVAMAIENSPTVQFARADVKAAEADVKQQNASLYPDIRLELGGSLNDDIDGRDDTEYRRDRPRGLRYNLYRGGADVARIREFKYRQAEALDVLRKNERKVAEDTRVSWNAIEVSHNNVDILRREVEANEAPATSTSSSSRSASAACSICWTQTTNCSWRAIHW